MPLTSAQTFEDILLKLSVLRYIFKSRSKRGRYDLNKQAENFFRDILNLVYGLDLVNLNEKVSNAPIIDLGDKGNRICIQVTAERESVKIRDTINGFLKRKLYNQYDRLVILIITEKRSHTTDFDTKSKFNFSKEDDIWDIDDLLERVEMLDLNKAEELKNYLSKELAPIVAAFAEPNSLLAKAEAPINTPPKTAEKFLSFLNFEPEDSYWKDELISIRQFYKKLSRLSRKQREFLSIIVNRGEVKDNSVTSRIRIFPSELENFAKLSCEEVVNYFQVLDSASLAYCDEDDRPHQIVIYFQTYSDSDLFVMFKQFLRTDEKINKLLVDGDFTVLD
jgi:hypothetical protein